MINITYREGADASSLSIKGHAGYAEHGSDIVCSAVSTLAIGLINRLSNHGTRHLAEMKAGDLSLTLLNKCLDDTARAYIEFTLDTLEEIAASYPSYVALSRVHL